MNRFTGSERIDTDECDPPTDAMGVLEGATTAGSPATLHLHHLHGLLTALAPLRAGYAAAAVERARALPLDARRAVLPHVLREHPGLAVEPRVRAMVGELRLDTDPSERVDVVSWLANLTGVRAPSDRDALSRVERALVGLATSVAEIARWRRELIAECVGDADHDGSILPEDPHALVASLIGAEGDPRELDDRLARETASLVLHSMTVVHAARDAAQETLAREEDPFAFEARAKIPRWWPSPFREAALWSRLVAERRSRRERRRERVVAYDEAFARAYSGRFQAEQD